MLILPSVGPVASCGEPDEIDNGRDDDAGDISDGQTDEVRGCAAVKANATDAQQQGFGRPGEENGEAVNFGT